MTAITQLKDDNDNYLLPITNIKAVYDDNGNRLKDTLDDMDEEINSKTDSTMLSDAYVNGKTYSVGEYCIYNNELWKCLVNNNEIPNEGANWTKTNICQSLSNFQGGVDSIYDALVAKGSTPNSKSLSDIIDGISKIQGGSAINGVSFTLRVLGGNGMSGWGQGFPNIVLTYNESNNTFTANQTTGSYSDANGNTAQFWISNLTAF